MVILTGGAGFIGSCFLGTLNAKGVTDILVVDNLGSSDKWKNLRGLSFVDYIHKDDFFRQLQADQMPKNVQAIIHLGACSSTTERNAEYMMANNYHFTRTLAEWALSKNIRFIYASSAATYGTGQFGFSDDDKLTLRLRPLNLYGFTKQLVDCWALTSGAAKKIVGVKFFNVFGPNEYHKGPMTSVVYQAYCQIEQTGRVRLFKSYRPEYKDGEQRRDFVYVKDCCKILYWFLEHPEVNGIYNLGTGNSQTWNSLANAVFSALNLKPAIDYIDMPENVRNQYQYFTEAKMEKLRAAGCDIKFRPLADAVADYVKNHLAVSVDNSQL